MHTTSFAEDAVGVQRLLVEVGLDLADLAAVGNGIAAPATEASCGRMKLVRHRTTCLGELVARQGELQDRPRWTR